jgi:hypothetical protein
VLFPTLVNDTMVIFTHLLATGFHHMMRFLDDLTFFVDLHLLPVGNSLLINKSALLYLDSLLMIVANPHARRQSTLLSVHLDAAGLETDSSLMLSVKFLYILYLDIFTFVKTFFSMIL